MLHLSGHHHHHNTKAHPSSHQSISETTQSMLSPMLCWLLPPTSMVFVGEVGRVAGALLRELNVVDGEEVEEPETHSRRRPEHPAVWYCLVALDHRRGLLAIQQLRGVSLCVLLRNALIPCALSCFLLLFLRARALFTLRMCASKCDASTALPDDDAADPVVAIQTLYGDIFIRLRPDAAPATVRRLR